MSTKTNKKDVTVSLRVPGSLHDILTKIALREDRTLAATIRRVLAAAVQKVAV